MPQEVSSETNSLKIIYQEIINGSSFSDSGFYVKHLSDLDQIEITRRKEQIFFKYHRSGIPKEETRLKQLILDGEWSTEKENDIQAYSETIRDNEKLLFTIIEVQKPHIQKIIDEHKKSLLSLILEKRLIIGTTCEELTNRDVSTFFFYESIYKDKECKEKLFSSCEELDDLEEHQISIYSDAIDIVGERMSDLNIRKIASMPFFLNSFSYSKDAIWTFLNKPISQLTNYQMHLFSCGSRNMNVLSQSEGSPPEDASPIDMAKWYDTQYSIILGKRNNK